MLIDQELKDNVRNLFNLNQYEVDIWVHLLSKGVSTAGKLSELSNVPRSRAYDVLEGLEKKGFVVIKIGKPIQYIAIPPKEVINRVKKQIEDDSKKQVKKLESIKDSNMISELTNLYDNSIKTYAPTELSGAFRGRKNIYDQIESMIRNSQNNVKIVTTEEGTLRKLNTLKRVIKKAHERGVTIQVNAPLTEKNQSLIEELAPLIEFKNTESNARYCIVDNKQALLLLLNDAEVHPNYDVGVLLNSEAISKELNQKS